MSDGQRGAEAENARMQAQRYTDLLKRQAEALECIAAALTKLANPLTTIVDETRTLTEDELAHINGAIARMRNKT